jgi:catechol 2,3-dioxygenase-like lactoylglutathione lyase family enzyme
VGQINAVSFSIPRSSLGYWISYLIQRGIQYQGPTLRFGEQVLSLRDPDGLAIELVARPEVQDTPGWYNGIIPAEHAIRGIASVTLWEDDYEKTARLLTSTFGFRLVSEEQNTFRYEPAISGPDTWIDLRNAQGFWKGGVGAGMVHHVAWRVATNEAQVKWQEILGQDFNVTPVLNREYFRSIYFPEPGGALFEIATDPPGFTVNEPLEQLGTRLQLPLWLEPQRSSLEQMLPALRLPSAQKFEDA